MKEWKVADIGKFLKNSLIAILKGEFLLRINAGRYFVHILYTFFIFCLVIWVSLTIEATMSKVTKNQKELEELRIANTQKVYELISLSTRASVSGRLSVMGSELKEPETPAYNIKK